MKKILTTCLILILYCCQKSKNGESHNTFNHITSLDLAKGILYEVNIRQFTKEGTFNALAKELPKIKNLGVNILWLMPTYPISTTKSKGPLGSYYAVSDYKGVNSEYGSLNDKTNQHPGFKDNRHDQSILSLVRKIHGSIELKDETLSHLPESKKWPIWAKRYKG